MSHNLAELLRKFWNILVWCLSYEFLFTTARTLPSCMFEPTITPFIDHALFYRGPSLSLYTHTHLVLTFVVISKWTTLDLRRLMWKHGLS
jgi:hypothetical protein